MFKLRKEELDAKFVLEKLVYKDMNFLNSDRPDIRDLDGEIGVEHRLVTTQDAMLMEKYLEDYLDTNPDAGEESMRGREGALLMENEILDTDRENREMRWKVGLLEIALREKLKKLNEGGYATYARNELFLTMREYLVTDGIARAFALRLSSIQAPFRIAFNRIYIFAVSGLYVIEGGAVVNKITINDVFLRRMEENTAHLMDGGPERA